MPSFTSKSIPFQVKGMNVSLPVDQVPLEQCVLLQNVRPDGAGQLTSRPGQTKINSTAIPDLAIHTIGRLNSPNESFLRLLGVDTALYSGTTSFTSIATGFSGSPISIVTVRPIQSPSPWAYIADTNKMVKVDAASTVKTIGLPMDSVVTVEGVSLDYADPAEGGTFAIIGDFSSVTNWTATGSATGLATGERLSSSAASISLSNLDFQLSPSAQADFDALGLGAMVYLSTSTSGRIVSYLPTPPGPPTLSGFALPDNSSGEGEATIVFLASGVEAPQPRTFVTVTFGISEDFTTNIQAVIPGPDPFSWSIRVDSGTSFLSDGQAVTAKFFPTITLSTPINGSDTMSSPYIGFAVASGVGTAYTSVSGLNLGFLPPQANLHLSLYADAPDQIVQIRVLFSSDTDFTDNYYYAYLTPLPTSTFSWTEFFIPLASLVPVGKPENMPSMLYMGLEITAIGTVNARWGSVTLDTSSGPDSGDGGEPYLYRCRFRDSTTGATSQILPATRAGIFSRNIPLKVKLGAGITAPAGADSLDFERFGGSIASTGWHYLTTVSSSGAEFFDITPDAAIATNPPLDANTFPPFPIVGSPLTGVYRVVGSALSWISGDTLPSNLAPGTLINLIGGGSNSGTQTVTLYSAPTGTQKVAQTVESFNGDPSLGNVTVQIPNPILLATPLPRMWGPYPQGLFLFACGDLLNPGTLYLTNPNDPDSSSDTNSIELTSPSEPLMNGCIFGNDAYVLTTERLLLLQATFTNFESGTGNLFQAQEVPGSVGHGLAAPQSLCSGGAGIFWAAEDGIYTFAGGEVKNISDRDLYPLFPHGGQAAQSITPVPGGVTLYPPNLSTLVLCYMDGRLYVDYLDSNNGYQTLIYDLRLDGWWFDSYIFPAISRFAETGSEAAEPSTLLMGSATGFLLSAGGDSDAGAGFEATVITPAISLSPEARQQKLWGDAWLDLISTVTVTATAWFNYNQGFGVSPVIPATTSRKGVVIDIALGAGVESPTMALEIAWPASSGESATIYQWAPSFIVKPEDTILRATDWDNAGTEQAKYIMGCEIECNTGGSNQSVKIEFDGGTVAQTIVLNANGQIVLPFAFDPPFTAHSMRLVPQTSGVAWQFFGVRWIFQPYPEDTAEYTPWGDAGFLGSKYIRGLVLDCDTANISVAVGIGVDQDQSGPSFSAKADGRSQIEIAFDPPFTAQTLQLQPQAAMRIFGLRWVFDPYPEQAEEYMAWDTGFAPGSKYIRALLLDCDTQNASVTVGIGVDQSGSGPSFSAQANGRTVLEIPFDPPFTAQTLQIQPTAAMRIFNATWIGDAYPEDASEYTAISPISGPGTNYIRGLILEADTGGSAVSVQVLGDEQALLTTISVTAAGRTELAFAFNPPLVSHVVQLAPQAAMRIFNSKWIADAYPEIAPIQTAWEDAGYSGEKFVQGLILNADSAGADVTIQVLTDGDADGPSFVANHQGQTEKPYSFATPFLAHSLALAPAGNIRIFGARWIFNPAPELTGTWTTPPSSLGLRGYAFLRDGWIAYAASAAVSLVATRDGIADPAYSLPSTSGALSKLYVPFIPGKFRTIQFSFTSSQPFQVMKQDCEVRVRSWAQMGKFQTIRPFGDQNFTSGATI